MTVSTIDITVALPRSLVQKLELAARAQHTSLADIVADALDHVLPAAAELPSPLLGELLAMVDLSDAALQQAAAARLDPADDQRLRALDEIGRNRDLATDEAAEREGLVARWQEAVVKRSQALMLLQRRGYDVPRPDDTPAGAAA